MAKVYSLGQMVEDMKVNSKMVKEMAKVYTLSQMVKDMKVNTKMI